MGVWMGVWMRGLSFDRDLMRGSGGSGAVGHWCL
jgi:hypothetical protein